MEEKYMEIPEIHNSKLKIMIILRNVMNSGSLYPHVPLCRCHPVDVSVITATSQSQVNRILPNIPPSVRVAVMQRRHHAAHRTTDLELHGNVPGHLENIEPVIPTLRHPLGSFSCECLPQVLVCPLDYIDSVITSNTQASLS